VTDRKISELTNITGADLADNDEFVVVDISTDETKAITYGELKNFNGTLTSDSLTVDGGTIKLDGNYPTGTGNVALGDTALQSITSGADNNTAVGYQALTANTTAALNTAVGYQSMDANTTGVSNTSVGGSSLGANVTGDSLTAVGSNALLVNTTSGNTAVGANAAYSNTSGRIDAFGTNAAFSNTTGNYNSAFGQQNGFLAALQSNTTGSSNAAFATGALGNTTTGSSNTGIGVAALYSNTTASNNTAVGYQAGYAITTGAANTAVGYAALSSDDLGSRSVAIGNAALFYQNYATATDSYNTAVGDRAGNNVTTGTQNTFVGGLSGDGTDDGLRNTAVGYNALSANADNDNTAIGVEALSLTTAANSTAVGQKAGSALTSGSNCLFLGKNAGLTGNPGGNFTTQSNALVIGNVSTSAAHVQVDWTVASDQRDKTDFTALDLGLDFVKALAPVTYRWDKRAKYGDITADDYDLAAQTPDGTHKEDWLDIGFKAQEVQALEEAAGYTTASKKNLTVSTSDDGKQMGLQYSKFVPILVKAIQELSAKNDALEARIATLEGN